MTTAPPATGAAGSAGNSEDFAQDMLASIDSISQKPVEMNNLTPETEGAGAADEGAAEDKSDAITKSNAAGGATQPAASEVDGIGPATDRPPAEPVAPSEGKQLAITLLLHATDTRHPYVIDAKYLERRNIELPEKDPAEMSVYTLKELILRDWRPEWQSKPASPTSIRLIHMGRLLEDKWYLKDARFVCGTTPHIVHMTIKPQEVIDEEDARMGKGGRDREGGGCRCTIL